MMPLSFFVTRAQGQGPGRASAKQKGREGFHSCTCLLNRKTAQEAPEKKAPVCFSKVSLVGKYKSYKGTK
eukprot:1140856-Pelagomonas_calceolata.AAC.1